MLAIGSYNDATAATADSVHPEVVGAVRRVRAHFCSAGSLACRVADCQSAGVTAGQTSVSTQRTSWAVPAFAGWQPAAQQAGSLRYSANSFGMRALVVGSLGSLVTLALPACSGLG